MGEILDIVDNFGNKYLNVELILASDSKFNKIQVFHSKDVGYIFLLNNEVMHLEKFQFLYHEPLVHVPAAFIQNINKVLIIGDGELFATAEVLKYANIEKVTLIEIDSTVIETMLKIYPYKNKIFNDCRLEIVYDDAYKRINKLTGEYDLIINDALELTLLNKAKYHCLFSLLSEKGVCVEVFCRGIFNKKMNIKLIKEIVKFKNCRFGLISIPYYPGWLHLLSMWGKNKYLKEELKKPKNIEQINCPEKFNFEFYSSSYLPFFLYLPPYLKTYLDF